MKTPEKQVFNEQKRKVCVQSVFSTVSIKISRNVIQKTRRLLEKWSSIESMRAIKNHKTCQCMDFKFTTGSAPVFALVTKPLLVLQRQLLDDYRTCYQSISNTVNIVITITIDSISISITQYMIKKVSNVIFSYMNTRSVLYNYFLWKYWQLPSSVCHLHFAIMHNEHTVRNRTTNTYRHHFDMVRLLPSAPVRCGQSFSAALCRKIK